MPLILSRKSDEAKAQYLDTLFKTVYLTDIVERNGIRNETALESLVSILASGVGSLTNPKKLARTFKSKGIGNVSDKTLGSYISFLQDAFLIEKAQRYDVKGKRYIDSPFKYYFTDVGLRNVRINFRQQEENHIMENIIYSELLIRGFNVDVGVVEQHETTARGKHEVKKLEVDFVCNKGSLRYYIQSAFAMPDERKLNQEKNALMRIDDSFKKIIVDRDTVKPWRTDEGILIIGVQEFLLNKDSLNQ
jgi:predicted AAA+ superfamily ATPase